MTFHISASNLLRINLSFAAQVLAGRIEGLLSIVESQQKTISNQTQALTLKGMWASILAPHSAALPGIVHQIYGRYVSPEALAQFRY